MSFCDNAPTFTSSKFQDFMEGSNIPYCTTTPYSLASNGLAERAVRELKIRLDKMSDVCAEEAVSKGLFFYRFTPHATTGAPPGQLLIGYKPVSRIDKMKPDIPGKLTEKQENLVDRLKGKHDA